MKHEQIDNKNINRILQIMKSNDCWQEIGLYTSDHHKLLTDTTFCFVMLIGIVSKK